VFAGSEDFQLSQDAEGLRVALETVGKPEPHPRQSIKDPLTQMAKRRMTKIMCSRRRLDHDMIKTPKIMKQLLILHAEESHSDRTSDRCHLDRMGEPIVHYSTGRHRGDHLRDVGQPRECAREPDPLQVSAELRLARWVRAIRLRMRPGQPGIHVSHATEPRGSDPLAVRNLRVRGLRAVYAGCNVCRPSASCVKLAHLVA
jgi:hypothetical protein